MVCSSVHVLGGLLPRLRRLPGWRLVWDVSTTNPRSLHMSRKTKAAQGSAAQAQKFSNMKPIQKALFIGKTFIFFLTFGFAYPNILGD